MKTMLKIEIAILITTRIETVSTIINNNRDGRKNDGSRVEEVITLLSKAGKTQVNKIGQMEMVDKMCRTTTAMPA